MQRPFFPPRGRSESVPGLSHYQQHDPQMATLLEAAATAAGQSTIIAEGTNFLQNFGSGPGEDQMQALADLWSQLYSPENEMEGQQQNSMVPFDGSMGHQISLDGPHLGQKLGITKPGVKGVCREGKGWSANIRVHGKQIKGPVRSGPNGYHAAVNDRAMMVLLKAHMGDDYVMQTVKLMKRPRQQRPRTAGQPLSKKKRKAMGDLDHALDHTHSHSHGHSHPHAHGHEHHDQDMEGDMYHHSGLPSIPQATAEGIASGDKLLQQLFVSGFANHDQQQGLGGLGMQAEQSLSDEARHREVEQLQQEQHAIELQKQQVMQQIYLAQQQALNIADHIKPPMQSLMHPSHSLSQYGAMPYPSSSMPSHSHPPPHQPLAEGQQEEQREEREDLEVTAEPFEGDDAPTPKHTSH